MNLHKLSKIIDKYEYISFDVFDTLLLRKVSKNIDVFNYIAGNGDVPGDYPLDRKKAEKKARENKNEPTLEDVYNEMLGYTPEKTDYLINEEKKAESLICTRNNKIFDVYKLCKEKNKKIIIITDMYLDEEFIGVLLKQNGYDKYEKLYVSNKFGKSKSKCSLYSEVIKDLDTKPGNILHIGDNLKSDFLNARLMGLNSFRVINDFNGFSQIGSENENVNSFGYGAISKFIESELTDDYSEIELFGYSVLGTLLYGFSKWLNKKIDKDYKRKVFFLAREGLLLKKAYEILYPNSEVSYLYVSRRSLCIASLADVKNYDDVVRGLSLRTGENIHGFLSSLDMFDEYFINLIKENNLDLNARADKKEFIDLINSHIEVIKDKATETGRLVKKYLKEKGFYGKVAIVDIGWNGTMQDALARLYKDESDIDIVGYYLGVRKNCKSSHLKKGFIYNGNENFSMEQACRGMNGLLELTFCANHGTTLRYEDINGEVMPVLDKTDIPPKMLSDVEKMQNKALSFVKDAVNDDFIKELDLDGQEAFLSFYEMGTNPKIKHIKIFNNFYGFNIKTYPLVIKGNLLGYMLSPNKFKNDLRNSGWKIGFLKYNLRLPLPYLKVFKILQKNKDKFK